MSKELAQELDPVEVEEAPKEEVVEAKEEPVATEEAPQEGEKEAPKPDKTVPLAALHEERQRRKEFQAQLQKQAQEAAQFRQVMEQRFEQIQRAAHEARQPKPPSFEDDPIANIKAGVDATQQELADLRAWRQQEYERSQAESQQREFVARLETTVRADVAAFRAETPDYDDALVYARQARVKQHMALGMDEQEAVQVMLNEEYQLSHAALVRGKSPAQAVYEIAQAYGWTKKPPEKPAQQEKIETLQKGVKAASSLGSGGTPTGKVTVDAVANMSDDEFADFMKSGGWSKFG